MDEQILTSSQRHMLAWHLATLKAQVRFLSELLNIPNLEAQQETPASAETTSSLQATAPTADGQNGSSTSFEWSCPAKEATGEPAITATVTFPVPNLLLTVGDLQRLVQEGNWIRLSPMTSEQLSRFGATPSTTPVEEVGGPSAGGAEPSPDSPASSPEPAQGGSEKPKIVVFAGGSVLWACGGCQSQVDVFNETCPACGVPNPLNAVRLY